MGSKIQPFKALGQGLQLAAPFANFIPGAQGWMGPAAGLLGGALSGGGKKKGVQGMPPIPPELLQRLLGLADQGSKSILDTPGTVRRFRDDATAYADRSSESTGARLAQSTGNPYMREAAKLDAHNRATESGNEFQRFAYSPEGQASAYERALGLYQPALNAHLGLEGLRLQGKQISEQFRQPTVWETLLNTAGGNLGTILDLLKNKKSNKPVAWDEQPTYLRWDAGVA